MGLFKWPSHQPASCTGRAISVNEESQPHPVFSFLYWVGGVLELAAGAGAGSLPVGGHDGLFGARSANPDRANYKQVHLAITVLHISQQA